MGTSGKTGFHYGFHDGAPDGAFLHVTVSFLDLFEFQLQISNPGINYHLDNRKKLSKICPKKRLKHCSASVPQWRQTAIAVTGISQFFSNPPQQLLSKELQKISKSARKTRENIAVRPR